MLDQTHFIYSSLTVAQFRGWILQLIRFGYPADGNRRLILTEMLDDEVYLVAVQPCYEVELESVIHRLDHEWKTRRVELDTAWLAGIEQQIDYVGNRLYRLGRYQKALDWPLATIEAYPEKSGCRLAFANRYAASIPPDLRDEEPFPEFSHDFLTLIDFVKRRCGKRTMEEQGPRIGTDERVIEAHHLAKNGFPVTTACKMAHTHIDTYYKWCEWVTGEEPITPEQSKK